MRKRSRDRDFLVSKYIENTLVDTSADGNFCPRTVLVVHMKRIEILSKLLFIIFIVSRL
jgi:hypothetical protein